MKIKITLVCVFTFSIVVPSAASAEAYSFDQIAISGDRFATFGDHASINCSGAVAFAAAGDSRSGVYVSDGHTVTVIHERPTVANEYAGPVINDDRTVAYRYLAIDQPTPVAKSGLATENRLSAM